MSRFENESKPDWQKIYSRVCNIISFCRATFPSTGPGKSEFEMYVLEGGGVRKGNIIGMRMLGKSP